MDIRIFNQSFQLVGFLESVDSFIWNEKFRGEGEFELYTNFNAESFALLQIDYYIAIPQSEKMMIIDTVSIKTNPDTGNKLLVKGLSLESIPGKRIFLRQILLDGALDDGIHQILNKEIIDGIFPERNISNFLYEETTDPNITSQTLKAQYYTENVLDTIKHICEQADIGFKIVLNSSNQFVFSLYSGSNRSYDQLINPYVVFSPNFDNLLNSEYLKSKRNKRNYAFIAGEDGLNSWNQNYYGRWGQVWTESLTVDDGFKRLEIFLDADNLPKFDTNEVEITDADYVEQLEQRGLEELSKHQEIVYFDGQIDVTKTYQYNVDFFLGDYVQISNEYGVSSKAQIIEITFSENLNGSSIFPILRTV